MKILIRNLLNGPLLRFAPTNHANDQDAFYCSNIRFWDDRYDVDSIYIAKASQLTSPPEFDMDKYQLQILLILDSPIPPAYSNCPQIKIVSFPASTDPFALYNVLDDHFSAPRHAMKLDKLLQNISKENYQEIAKELSSLINCSCALMTGNLHTIASVSIDQKNSPLWELLSNKGVYPDYNMRYMLPQYRCMVMKKADRAELFPILDYPYEKGDLFCPITQQDEIADVLGYIYCHNITQDAAHSTMSILNYISQLLAVLFRQFSIGSRRNDLMFILTLERILDGELWDSKIIHQVLEKQFFKQPAYMTLITILPELNAPHLNPEQLANYFIDIWPNDQLFIHDSHLCILISSNEQPEPDTEQLNLLQERLKAHSCTAGISETFHTLDASLRNYYHRTMCAAIVASHANIPSKYASYKETALYQIVADTTDTLAVSRFRGLFVDPNLVELINYDKTHNTDYLLTLRYYWHYNRNSAKICEQLHIQRSTLFYRLGRVHEFLKQDYNDYHNLIQLSLGIAILESRGEIPFLDLPDNALPPSKQKDNERTK